MKRIILVIDMLKGFLEEGKPLFCGKQAQAIIPNIVDLLKKFKDAKIIFVCDQHDPDDKEFQMFPPHCIKGTEEAEIVDELKQFEGKIIPKTRFSAFFNTDLDKILAEENPDEIIVCGVCTNICVLYTVADARFRDYKVIVPKNCVASFDAQAHEFALKEMEKVLGAKVVDSI